MSEDDWGCLFTAVLIAAGGYWAYSNYEIREKDSDPPKVFPTYAPAKLARPTGRQYVTSISDGTEWFLDSGTVRGPRDKRVGWIEENHSKNNKRAERITNILYQVNCDTTHFLPLSTVDYGKDGKVIRSIDHTGTGSYAPPRSRIGLVVDFMCQAGFDTPK